MKTKYDHLKGQEYKFIPVNIASIHNKHIKLTGNDNIFYIKRINEFGDSVLQIVASDCSYETIGNIQLSNKRKITILFRHHGISSKADIKYIDIQYCYGGM